MEAGGARGLVIMQSVIVMALTLGLVQGAVYRGRPGVAEGPESFCGCVQAASSPGDSCLLQGGHYEVSAPERFFFVPSATDVDFNINRFEGSGFCGHVEC